MIQDLILDLSDFTIEDTIGSGGYGIVYLIKEKSSGKLFAAKVSQKECKTTKDQKSLFQEILSYSKIKNNAILSLYGFNLLNFKGEHYPTIITPYMPNGSLDKLIEENKEFPSSKKYIILLGIAEGMKYLHSLKIIHRDLKAGNIVLDENYHPYISDFGTAKLSEKSISSLVMDTYNGTEIYMAPEIIKGEPYTHKIDIYSFSILAYELITSNLAFPGYANAFLVQKDIMEGIRPDLSLISNKTIRDLLSRCWSEKPSLRPDFSEIVEIIKNEKFIKAMKANIKDVNEYLRIFGEKEILIEPRFFTFQLPNGKYLSLKISPLMKADEVLKEIQKIKKIESDSYIVLNGRVVDNNSTLLNVTENFVSDDDDILLIVNNGIPDKITVELQFQKGIPISKKKFEFIRGSDVYNVRLLLSMFFEDTDSLSLEANGDVLCDYEILENDALIIVDKCLNLKYFNDENTENDDKIFERANGLIKKDKKDPKNKFIYKFKYFNENNIPDEVKYDEFEISLPKNVTVKYLKDKICDVKRYLQLYDVHIFVGNHELDDFQKLSKIQIPKKVKSFKIYITKNMQKRIKYYKKQ